MSNWCSFKLFQPPEDAVVEIRRAGIVNRLKFKKYVHSDVHKQCIIYFCHLPSKIKNPSEFFLFSYDIEWRSIDE